MPLYGSIVTLRNLTTRNTPYITSGLTTVSGAVTLLPWTNTASGLWMCYGVGLTAALQAAATNYLQVRVERSTDGGITYVPLKYVYLTNAAPTVEYQLADTPIRMSAGDRLRATSLVGTGSVDLICTFHVCQASETFA